MTWQNSTVALDGTHHLAVDGPPLYTQRFTQVLPFHEPGLAPVSDASGAYHIEPDGKPAYTERFSRTFGFYEDRATVRADKEWFHILPDGSQLYKERWAWCGNYQKDRCAVQDTDGGYYHLKPDGTVVSTGPWAYAGDYREGVAVVRGQDGLCHHIDPEGQPIHDMEFFDLDVFHKGFARARDCDGWFHIDRKGKDISGMRYEILEPFYNGQALAQRKDGRRVILDETGQIINELPASDDELKDRLHGISIAYWAPFAVKLGLDRGLADGKCSSAIPPRALKALQNAWVELGLLEEDNKCLTPVGLKLIDGTVERQRFDYWLGPQLGPWLDSFDDECLDRKKHFFHGLDEYLVQCVLDSYAKDDWKGIANIIELDGIETVVDIGGGMGRLLDELLEAKPKLNAILVERSEVLNILPPRPDIQYEVGDIFEGDLPKGELYIMSRVLHDWNDKEAARILKHLKNEAPRGAHLCVIDRVTDEKSYGLLDLNMFLVNDGCERNLKDWNRLFGLGGWFLRGSRDHHGHLVMKLEKGDAID